jgi:hypothetical protein
MDDLKTRFLRVYSSLPLGVRREIILVLDPQEGVTKGGPITWEVAYIEVNSDTPLSKTILEKLAKLDFI